MRFETLGEGARSIDNPAGPKGYEISKDADITVVLYTKRTVKSNYAFKKGELDGKAIERIMKGVPRMERPPGAGLRVVAARPVADGRPHT